MNYQYKALRVFELDDGSFERKIVQLSTDQLPEGDVLIKVQYSGMNFKDALSSYGNKGVTRRYPHTPGVDAAGVVVESLSGNFKPGDQVVVGGYDLGMNTDGGFGGYIRVPSEWIVPLPEGMDLKESMIIGGTGYTAALSVMNLQDQGVKPEDGPILVTGAAGGVGSWSVLILKKLGYTVIAGTSNIDDSAEFIAKLGADQHVDKSVIDDTSGKALIKWKWAGAIDNVGGNVLSTAIRACKPGGTVTCCGNIYSDKLEMTVYPFILNAVKLIGISAQITPLGIRKRVWGKIAGEYKVELPNIIKEIGLDELPDILELVISKKNRGQVLLNHEK
jgi:acrylyl-CoA reductase (NADPH)